MCVFLTVLRWHFVLNARVFLLFCILSVCFPVHSICFSQYFPSVQLLLLGPATQLSLVPCFIKLSCLHFSKPAPHGPSASLQSSTVCALMPYLFFCLLVFPPRSCNRLLPQQPLKLLLKKIIFFYLKSSCQSAFLGSDVNKIG